MKLEITEEIVECISEALEKALHKDREGPYGLYDYSSYGDDVAPHHVRDFRDCQSDTYGSCVFKTADEEEAEYVYTKLTEKYVATAIINAINEIIN